MRGRCIILRDKKSNTWITANPLILDTNCFSPCPLAKSSILSRPVTLGHLNNFFSSFSQWLNSPSWQPTPHQPITYLFSHFYDNFCNNSTYLLGLVKNFELNWTDFYFIYLFILHLKPWKIHRTVKCSLMNVAIKHLWFWFFQISEPNQVPKWEYSGNGPTVLTIGIGFEI